MLIQKFKIEKLKRNQIKNASYNPRKIGDDEKKRLRKVLKKLGLLYPLVWNKKTGNLVSGHQRLSIIDDLLGTQDYELDYSVVDLSEKEEKEANIALNSQSITGEFDSEKLQCVLDEGIDIDTAGLTINDLNVLDIDTSNIFDEETEITKSTVDELKKIKKDYKNAKNEEYSDKRLLIVVFEDENGKNEIMRSFGIEDGTKYISQKTFCDLLNKK